ncbi:GntR family transcriptional regulator [Geochorda subterranea]
MRTVQARLLRTQVFEALREAIVTGQLSPGQRITELRIAREMGTSQAP